MSAGIGDTPVASEEWLARYVLRQEHVRADDTLKPDLFMPYKWVELSVTRHLGLTEEQIWSMGEGVAGETGTRLHGRADHQALAYGKHRLRVVPKPLPHNRNHAEAVDWPSDKPSQKEIALLIARDATFKSQPVV